LITIWAHFHDMSWTHSRHGASEFCKQQCNLRHKQDGLKTQSRHVQSAIKAALHKNIFNGFNIYTNNFIYVCNIIQSECSMHNSVNTSILLLCSTNSMVQFSFLKQLLRYTHNRHVPTVVSSGQDYPPLSSKWPPLVATNQYKIISKMCIHTFYTKSPVCCNQHSSKPGCLSAISNPIKLSCCSLD